MISYSDLLLEAAELEIKWQETGWEKVYETAMTVHPRQLNHFFQKCVMVNET